MKKHLLRLILFQILIFQFGFAVSQTPIYTLDFETYTGSEYATSEVEFSDGFNDFFLRTDGSDISSNVEFGNIQGTYYFAAMDIDGEGATLPLELNINDIDISGVLSLSFSIMLAEDDDGTNQDWDNNDSVHIQYDIDNSGIFTDLIWIRNSGTLSGNPLTTNTAPSIDADFNGIGDSLVFVTSDFTEFTADIVGTGSTLDIKIIFSLNAGDEDIAIDNIQILEPDITAPIATWDPEDAATDVYVYSDLVVEFDESIRNIDNSEITNGAILDALLTFKETDVAGADVSYTATIDDEKKIITINPDADLTNNQVYYLALAAVEDVFDNATIAENITFTTIDASTPFIDGASVSGALKFYAGEPVTVEWIAANISLVDIYVYIPDEDTWILEADDIADDGSEVITIPEDADYGTGYKLAVVGDNNTAITDTSDVFTIIATPSIYDIQSKTTDGDASSYAGDIIRTTGIVSYLNGNRYFLVDSSKAWNGVYVYDGTNAGTLTVGDSIVIEASVTEYFGLTELMNVEISSRPATGKSRELVEITTGELNEAYEAVPLKIINAQVTNASLGSGIFEINDGSGALEVDDEFYAHSAVLNENITISGVGYYSYSAFKILPGIKEDILSASDTVTSAEYTVDNNANTITGMVHSTTLATFESNIAACDSSSYDVYDADQITPATVLDDTKVLIDSAADGITRRIYTITRNAPLTDASISSSVYSVDNSGETVTGIPYGTNLATFESNITAPAFGSFETYQADATTVATDLQSTYVVIGTAEDGTTKKNYVITINPASTDAAVTSAVYTVDDVAETITDIPYNSDLATFEANFTEPFNGTFDTYEADGTTVATDLQSGYKLIGTAEDGSTTKTYTITLNSAPLDFDSYVQAPKTQIASSTIAVVDGDEKAEAFPVFAFAVTDSGTVDGAETEVSQIVLFFGANSTIDYATDIDSVYFDIEGTAIALSGEPVVGTDSIAFTIAADEISVPDNDTVTVTMNLILAADAGDGKVIQFMIDADQHGFKAIVSGSSFTDDFLSNIIGNEITIDVVATELEFTVQPSDVEIADTIDPAVVITALDANGNIDTDFADDIQIRSTGADLKYILHTVTPVNGVAAFDTLIYTSAGEGVVLSVSSASLANTSSAFNVIDPSIDIFFSEYVEGSSNNKALEIFNPTNSVIDLSNYCLLGTGNNATDWEYDYTFPEGATIAAKDVYVIVDDQAISAMQEVADWITTGLEVGFNGNDARGLAHIKGNDTIVIDKVGYEYNPDGLNYSVAGIASATAEHTLIRKAGRTSGNADWVSSAGTNKDDSEWKVWSQDSVSNLGLVSPPLSTETGILSINIPGVSIDSATKIVAENDSIYLLVFKSTQLDSLFPVFTLSEGATADPESGDSIDFSTGSAGLVVTAEDGTTVQTWTVYVVTLDETLSDADIVDVTIENQAIEAVIDAEAKIVTVYVEYGTDLSAITPTIELSAGATSDYEVGTSLNFIDVDSVDIAVTAEDGSLSNWKLTVKEFVIEVQSLAEVRALYDTSAAIKITTEVLLTAQMSYQGKKYVEDASAAILVFDPTGVITSTYALGDGITGLVGTLDYYAGMLEFVPVADPGAASSTGNTLTPQVVTLAELNANFDNYEAELITVQSVSFADGGGDFANGKNYKIGYGTDTIICRTDFYGTDLIGTAIPDSANVTGVAQEYNGDAEIFPRFLADVQELTIPVLSSDATLSDLTVDGTSVSGFLPAVLNYNVELPSGTISVTIGYTTSDDGATVDVSGPSDLTGDEAARTASVVVTSEDETASRTYKIVFTVHQTGIEDVNLSHVAVYPTPAQTELYVTNCSAVDDIQIFDISGKHVAQIETRGADQLKIDVRDLKEGLYIMLLRTDETVKTIKFVKE
ncbi:MAG: lamin tail domain-containing protein [Bacteroidales bacterium]|nr:lamin tail domain-containing protein [Bacteroidales bacterium]MBN2820982.1 lamin tail domain-containing protein [Bacteroidales bacterium]